MRVRVDESRHESLALAVDDEGRGSGILARIDFATDKCEAFAVDKDIADVSNKKE
jgi:hypothetical protein